MFEISVRIAWDRTSLFQLEVVHTPPVAADVVISTAVRRLFPHTVHKHFDFRKQIALVEGKIIVGKDVWRSEDGLVGHDDESQCASDSHLAASVECRMTMKAPW